ncbi:histone-arginine methyltransferase METTL23 isoform X3 [Dendropsophus ebraccatus]|uniref:histone-arginine methyltransferase METTL23 isoform X3 n=1 Tax=Dendropsophus ebraccatus TaxID=150705 RepID=UPI0038312E2D
MSGGEETLTRRPRIVSREYVYVRDEADGGAERSRELRIRIPEVGAGVSLPGIVAAKCGANVILSDSAALPQCLENCVRSCAENELSGVPVIGLTWGEISPDLLGLPPIDIILGSDVFYEPKGDVAYRQPIHLMYIHANHCHHLADFEDVLVTVRFIMERNPSAEFWTTYQVRSTNWSIEALLHKWDLRCCNIALKMFDGDRERLAGSHLPGRHSIQMMIITLKRDV